MIIDFHTHFYPSKVVEKALNAVSGRIEHHTDGTRSGLLDSMHRAGIDLSVGLPLVNTASNSRGVNSWARQENSAPVAMLGSIHPDEPDPLSTLESIAAAGLPGIKLHPEYQNFEFSDERLFPVWERCCELGLFVLTHAGYDVMFSPPWHTDPERLAAFHRRFPELKLVLAHLGGMNMWDDVERHLTGLPVYLDLAMVTSETIPPEQLTRIIRAHGAQHILFGSDSPWYDQKRQLDFIRSLPLTPREQELIFCKNAMNLLKIKEK